jgi:hypothetical protein
MWRDGAHHKQFSPQMCGEILHRSVEKFTTPRAQLICGRHSKQFSTYAQSSMSVLLLSANDGTQHDANVTIKFVTGAVKTCHEFQVRSQTIFEWLIFLKDVNPQYKDIVIDETDEMKDYLKQLHDQSIYNVINTTAYVHEHNEICEKASHGIEGCRLVYRQEAGCEGNRNHSNSETKKDEEVDIGNIAPVYEAVIVVKQEKKK